MSLVGKSKKRSVKIKALLIRSVSIFLLFTIFSNIILPVSAIAVTINGPQPEFTGYGSASSNSMVDLFTGDLNINIPLLYVPGPEGGFSMPLNYSAGIAPEQEASWVGLGWSMNPGAINRNVVQYPDDFNGEVIGIRYYKPAQNADNYMLFWLGLINNVTIVSGHDFSGKAYQGRLVSDFLGNQAGEGTFCQYYSVLGIVNWKPDEKGKQQASFSGEGLATFVITVAATIATFGIGGAAAGATKAVQTTAQTIREVIDVVSNIYSIIQLAQSVAEMFNGGQSSSNQGMYVGVDFDESCPIDIWVEKYCNQTVAIDYSENTKAYGALYLGHEDKIDDFEFDNGAKMMNKFSFKGASKTLQLFGTNSVANNVGNDSYQNINSSDYAKVLTPAQVAKDQFMVLGEGIVGSISPFRPEAGSLATPHNMGTNKRTLRKYALTPFNNDYKPQFRYKGMPSNKYTFNVAKDINGNEVTENSGVEFKNYAYTPTTPVISTTLPNLDLDLDITDEQFCDLTQKIEPARNGFYPNQNYDGTTQHSLALGKHINWFTNSEIKSMSDPTKHSSTANFVLDAPFLDFLPSGNSRNSFRSSKPQNGIGGFSIVREDGCTYHYALPIYTLSEQSGSFANSSDNVFSAITNNNPYSVTWLLTGITGADFVDRGELGVLDGSDWGYWVKLEYGQYSNNYISRTPYMPNNIDEETAYHSTTTAPEDYYYRTSDNNFDAYSKSSRELYYLDAVKTRTHTALFIKDVRNDARGLSPSTNGVKGATLSLQKIYLLENSIYQSALVNGLAIGINNVFDINDLNTNLTTYLDKNTSKKFEFNYDYSLCPNVPNNINNEGKLTLKSVSFFGSNNVKTTPDYTFEYSNNPAYGKNKWDGWGMYCSDPSGGNASTPHLHRPVSSEIAYNTSVYNYLTQNAALAAPNSFDGAAWSLTSLTTPMGSRISILYERDTYSYIGGVPVSAYYTGVSEKAGGGLRVAKLTTLDPINNYSSQSVYVYRDEQGNPSGVCSSETEYVSNEFLSKYPPQGTQAIDSKYNSFVNYKNFFDYPMLPITYSHVQVYNGLPQSGKYIDKNSYEFETMKNVDNLLFNNVLTSKSLNDTKIFPEPDGTTTSGSGTNKAKAKLNFIFNNVYNKITNKISSIGSLLVHNKYDPSGNIISSTVNTYQNEMSDDLGVFAEHTSMLNDISGFAPGSNFVASSIKTINSVRTLSKEYPSVLSRISSTVNGIATQIDFKGNDFITGQPLISITTDSYGNKTQAQSVPAYTKYPAMGSKAENLTNKNMLSQEYAKYTYRLNSSGQTDALLDANFSTWSNSSNVSTANDNSRVQQSGNWRKSASYIYHGDLSSSSSNINPDGSYSKSAFAAAISNQNDPGWKKVGQYSLFDQYSHPLETIDVNGNYSAKKYDNSGRFTIISAQNAKYSEIAYSGAETFLSSNAEGGVFKKDGLVVSDFAHTGTQSLLLSPGKEGFQFTLKSDGYVPGRKYRASVWVYYPGIAEDNLDKTQLYCKYSSGKTTSLSSPSIANISKKARSWYYVELVFTPDKTIAEDIIIGTKNNSDQVRSVYLDDFRVAPLNSTIETYVINPSNFTIAAVLNNDNLYQRYEYDESGRITQTYMERMGKPVEQHVNSRLYNYVR